MLDSLGTDLRAVVVGSTGGIGAAFVDLLAGSPNVADIYALSRTGASHSSAKVQNLTFDFTDPASIDAAAEAMRETGRFDIILIATGLLHGEGIEPEKNIRALSHDAFAQSFLVNASGPAMTAKAFLPLLHRDRKAVLAALSARVGSISDNRLGGWYAYRASKAALNQIIRTLAIEWGRKSKHAVLLALHPGTVDTDLSAPFQGNIPEGKLFTPEFSAGKLLDVIDSATPDDSGTLIDWAGETVAP